MTYYLKTLSLTFLLMFYVFATDKHLQKPAQIYLPSFVSNFKNEIKNHFKKPENANIIFALFGDKKMGIHYKTLEDLGKLNLAFLFSPSGYHLSVFFLFFQTLTLFKLKTFKNVHLIFTLIMSSLFPQHTIFRAMLRKTLSTIKFKYKIKIKYENLILLVFLISFLLGNFFNSPLSFIFSFAYINTFFCFKNDSKLKLAIGLFTTAILLNLFMAKSVSFFAVMLGLFLAFIFRYLFILILFYLLTFSLYPSAWIEPLIRSFILISRFFATYLRGTFTSSSLFLFLACLCLICLKTSPKKMIILSFCFFLHTNTARAPAIAFVNMHTAWTKMK